MSHYSKKLENWLLLLFASLFFLFPTVLPLSNLALFLLIVTWVFTIKDNAYKTVFLNTPVLWLLSALYLMVLIGTAWSPGNWEWISLHLAKYAKLLYAVVLVLLLTGRGNLQRAALNAFIAAMLFILLSTWLNVWFVLPWSITQETGWGKTHHVVGDYITQNIMMAFFAVLAVQRTMQPALPKQRAFWGITATLAIVSISHLSQGRTGLVVLLAGLLSYAAVVARGKRLVAAVAGVSLVLGLAFASSNILQNRFNEAVAEAQQRDVDQGTSIGHRLYNYKTTWNLISERPIFGHGTGAFHTEICRFIDASKDCPYYAWHPHNQFLFFGADHGIVGMILYVMLILGLYHTAAKSVSKEGQILLCALASILLVDSLFNSPLFSSRESQFFAYMIGLLVSMNPRASSAPEVLG